MVNATTEQSRVFLFWFMVIASLYLALPQYIDALTAPVANDPDNPAIKESAKPVVWFWFCAPLSLAFANPRTLPDTRRWVRVAVRFIWALGCVLCLLHIAVAFHQGHGWSHEAAWEHTKQVGGYGDGVYVNYAFALVWLVDAVWLCVAFDSYFTRPRWLHWTIHGFLAFIVFNAAVVFGSWGARKSFAFMVLFALLYLFVLWAVKLKKEASDTSSSPE
jgi:hypothetical protein